MPQPKTLSEIRRAGVSLEIDEAIAVIQQLVASLTDAATAPGPPSLETVFISSNGAVTCPTCTIAPTVLELGMLLQSLLAGDGGVRIPGALRYTMARALQATEAPPFDTVTDFKSALQRHEKTTDRNGLLRQLYQRATVTQVPIGAFAERRRHAQSVADLRRHLREADEERYLLLTNHIRKAASSSVVSSDGRAGQSKPPLFEEMTESAPRPRSSWRWGIGAAAAVVLSFGIGYSGMTWVVQPHDSEGDRIGTAFRIGTASRSRLSATPCESDSTTSPGSSDSSSVSATTRKQ